MSNPNIFLILVVLALVAEHYFPYWVELTGHKLPSPVRLIVNYSAGTLAWFGPFTAWLILNGRSDVALVGWGFALLAGLTVILLYVADRFIANKLNLRDSLEVNSLLERQKNDAKQRS